MIETDRIYLMDCMEGMKQIADGSVDAIIADLPYGVLNRSNPSVNWDRQIPLAALWEQYRRITKPDSPIILFGQGLFSMPNVCRSGSTRIFWYSIKNSRPIIRR